MIRVTIDVEEPEDGGVLRMLSAREHLWHDIGAMLVSLTGLDHKPPSTLSQTFSSLELSHRRPMPYSHRGTDPYAWPTDRPTEPGFYWCLLRDAKEPVVIRIMDAGEEQRARAISTTLMGQIIGVDPFEIETAGARWRPGAVTP